MALPQILPAIGDISHAIQLAIAPVFLLTGIAALLGVMTNRLARVIDRGRSFEQRWAHMSEDERALVQPEIRELEQRRRYASFAITASTVAALAVCLVVAALFLEALVHWPLKGFAGVMFLAATVSLVASLGSFLREVLLATYTARIWVTEVNKGSKGPPSKTVP